MKGKWRKRLFIFFASFMTGVLVSPGLFELASDLSAFSVHADGVNTVSFTSSAVEANESNIVYAEIRAEGNPGDVVNVTYRTSSCTAIENVDYAGVYNSASLTIDPSGAATYTVAIKCLNDASNREKLRVYSGDKTFGRYFNLHIVGVENGTVGATPTCKCYLPYDYRVSATIGIQDPYAGEISYLDDYKEMLSKYHEGDNDISGKEHWRTWKEGVSFNGETTQRWVNTYINPGFASAYCSYVLKNIDDDKLHSTTNIHMSSGNKEFMSKYNKDDIEKTPGCSLYYEIEPCTSGGYRIDGKAMYYISEDINPWKKDDDLVDLEELNICSKDRKRLYWIQEKKAWFSSANSIYDSMFYKTDPYEGTLDYGLSIYNGNKSWDREVHDIWLFMTLVDDKVPQIQQQYTEYDVVSGAIRIILRFNEPVYSRKYGSLFVRINGYTNNYYASYVDGNYSDTLVYEIPASQAPKTKITTLTYELPTEDIGDMAYNLDTYKMVHNNLVQNTDKVRDTVITGGGIDLSTPQLAVDIAEAPSPKAVHDIMLSANGNGATSFDSGTVYYAFDGNDYINDPDNPASYNKVHVLTSEENGSFAVTLAKNEAEGIVSGNYYLHALVVSQYGMVARNTFGPYCLDGDAPEITMLSPSVDLLRRKTFRLQIKDKAIGTKLGRINAIVRYLDAQGVEQESKLTLVQNNDVVESLGNRVAIIEDSGFKILEYRSNIDEADTTIKQDDFLLNLMGERARLPIDIRFEIIDAAGNKATSSSLHTIYDKRELFDNGIAAPASYHKDTSIDVSCDVYDVSNAGEDDGLTFSLTEADIKSLVDEGAKYSVIVNNDREFPADTYSVTLKGLEPGYYEAVGRVYGTSGITEVDMVSKTYSFYLTEGMKDDTINKVAAMGNLVLSNRVFQFEDARFYYFRSASSSVDYFLYGSTYNSYLGKYEGGSAMPAFSSSIEAKKYVKFMEYQDMELISISSTIASLLNSASGSTIYVKAPKETRNAIEGQLWLRYKKNSWTPSSGASGWGYYYYGEGNVNDGININGLSANLSAAIEAVTNRIVGEGKIAYLVGEDNTARLTGAPYLADSQMHVSAETYEASLSGNVYVTNPYYAGDAALYQNNVKIDDTSYPIATNLPLRLSASTSLYFKHLGSETWNKLEASDGMTLNAALSKQGTGLYTIREYGEGGVGEFTVYIDHDLPILKVTMNKGLAEEETITLDGSITTLTCKNLSLIGLIGEVDPLSYVAVYSYPNRNLVTVLYENDPNQGIANYSLSDGNYYLEVGDRSGNVVTYTVWTSETAIGLTAAENEGKTAVIVRVEGRSEAEIYSFEVFLNENLIDNEFDTYKIYRGAGIYRIEVADIYGNRETATVTHESPSPELTWYYLNDSGGYSLYDPNRPSKMVLQDDETSSRTTNVHSSTMVRVLLNNPRLSQEVEFEVLDIPSSDYIYNETTGMLTINSLSNWRLRVWYQGQPENDRLYVFSVDADAPEINASYFGTGFHPSVVYDENGNVVETSTFDSVNFDNYEDGDFITLDTLAYVNDGQMSLAFSDGAIISGNRIVLSLSDASGIRSYTVTRNGVPVEVETNEEGNLVLNGYGSYEVTVIDNLGNTTVLRFLNVSADIARGAVDDQSIEQDELVYGHETFETANLYDGVTLILVKVGDVSYTYEFHYESGVATYGQYALKVEEEMEEETLVLSKYVEYVSASGFRLDASEDSTRRNTWYQAIAMEDFVIHVLIDDGGQIHFRVSTLGKEIQVETRYEVGSCHLPTHFEAALSLEAPTLVLLSGDEEAEKVASLDYIYIAEDLSIDKTSVSPNITLIEATYSETQVFGEPTLLYQDGQWLSEFLGSEYGYYRIRVANKYGNETIYLVSKIESFASLVKVHTMDGASFTFEGNEGTFYANSSIDLIVFSSEVYFEVDGRRAEGYVEAGTTTLSLIDDGTYHVTVIGSNGIREDFDFEINSIETFLFEDAWIYGYNEDALLHDEGYTNTLCSIALDESVVYVEMTVNDDQRVVLYDNLTDDKRTDLEALKNAIGRYGVGKYTIGFRNRYGDLQTKTVYYNNIPSIVLTRSIASDPQVRQTYDLGLAIVRGFYSNYVMYFSTSSSTYFFTINGEEYRLDEPKSLEFSNISGIGSFSYLVTYLDEYGNYIEFYAILYRDDVDFDTSSMNLITVGNVVYTRDDVSITFDGDLKATLSVDGGDPQDYQSGELHFADGEYTFVVRDIAGNNGSFTVVHKSVNHYSLTISSTGEDVIEGGVVNNSNVVFSSEEGSRLKYIVRNGELVPEYTSNTFNLTGHYELLIEDFIGNQAYREFTILNNDLATFDYEAPFDYKVSEVWLVKADGTRELLDFEPSRNLRLDRNGQYLIVVTNNKTASSFNFSVGIDNTAPKATLNGVEDGGVTGRDVTISGLRAGDVVKIYKDGELLSSTTISIAGDAPTINTGGKYRVTITNVQGVTLEFNFIRKSISNVPGSIFIIVFCGLVVTAVAIGLTYHTKLKTDD